MNCIKCGKPTLGWGHTCISCQLMAREPHATEAWNASPETRRQLPPQPAYAHPEAVAWLMERCPHRVAPGTGHIEMQMPPDGVAFVKLVAAAIEHGRSLGPKIEAEDKTPEAATQDRFEMLEFDQ